MLEALIYTLPGLLAGAVIFFNFALLIGMKNILPAIILPSVLILVVMSVSVFVPALYISRLSPVEAFYDE